MVLDADDVGVQAAMILSLALLARRDRIPPARGEHDPRELLHHPALRFSREAGCAGVMGLPFAGG